MTVSINRTSLAIKNQLQGIGIRVDHYNYSIKLQRFRIRINTFINQNSGEICEI